MQHHFHQEYQEEHLLQEVLRQLMVQMVIPLGNHFFQQEVRVVVALIPVLQEMVVKVV